MRRTTRRGFRSGGISMRISCRSVLLSVVEALAVVFDGVARRVSPVSSRRRNVAVVAALTTVLATVLIPLSAAPTQAATATGASFSGGAGTFQNTTTGVLYARSGAALSLTVNLDAETTCVKVTDGTYTAEKAGPAGAAITFTATSTLLTGSTAGAGPALFTASAGEGVRTLSAVGFKNSNNRNCTANQGEVTGGTQASYTLDNTGPTVTGAVTQANARPLNAAGWATSDVTVAWSGTDGTGAGANAPTPTSATVTTDGTVTKTATATDKVGNSATGSVVVKLDKAAPTVTAARTPAAGNANGWNNSNVTVGFNCSDGAPPVPSGIKSCPSAVVLDTDGTNQSASGTATDTADNVSAAASVTGVNVDKTAPGLRGVAINNNDTTPRLPNAAGWYSSNVRIGWTCTDATSGFLTSACPAVDTVKSEGSAQTVSGSVTDKAGNTTTANSAPVNIDKTTPLTQVDNTNTKFNDTDVSIFLTRDDALSGVANTSYTLDVGATQAYDPATGIHITTPGVHNVNFWSEDKAGNVEDKTAPGHRIKVTIDGTPPTITAGQNPQANSNGWNNSDVTVTFTCEDAQSGIKSCLADGSTTASKTVTADGKGQTVTGTATDNAGNTAGATAHVSVDKSKPTITATRDPLTTNPNGWNNSDVKISFACDDPAAAGVIASGIDVCPAARTLTEGVNQSASGTVNDAAGNSASAGVTGVNVDKTDPNLSGSVTTSPNGDGWFKGDVSVGWACSDTLSGIAGGTATVPCPVTTSVVKGEGGNLSASASVSDKAGNTKGATVAGISIDRTAPSTTATATPAVDWARTNVNVTLAATDNLSGAKATFYTV